MRIKCGGGEKCVRHAAVGSDPTLACGMISAEEIAVLRAVADEAEDAPDPERYIRGACAAVRALCDQVEHYLGAAAFDALVPLECDTLPAGKRGHARLYPRDEAGRKLLAAIRERHGAIVVCGLAEPTPTRTKGEACPRCDTVSDAEACPECGLRADPVAAAESRPS